MERLKGIASASGMTLIGLGLLAFGLGLFAGGTGIWPTHQETLYHVDCYHARNKTSYSVLCWGYTREQREAAGAVPESASGAAHGPERVWTAEERPRPTVKAVRVYGLGWVEPSWEPTVWGLFLAPLGGALGYAGGSRLRGTVTGRPTRVRLGGLTLRRRTGGQR